MPSEDVSHSLESRDSVMAGKEHLCFSVSDTGPSCLGHCFDKTQRRHILKGYGFSVVNFKAQRMYLTDCIGSKWWSGKMEYATFDLFFFMLQCLP